MPLSDLRGEGTREPWRPALRLQFPGQRGYLHGPSRTWRRQESQTKRALNGGGRAGTALARDGVSREVPCSALKGETVPDSLPATPKCPPIRRVPPSVMSAVSRTQAAWLQSLLSEPPHSAAPKVLRTAHDPVHPKA